MTEPTNTTEDVSIHSLLEERKELKEMIKEAFRILIMQDVGLHSKVRLAIEILGTQQEEEVDKGA